MTAWLDPKAKKERPDWEKGAAHEKARRHGSCETLRKRELLAPAKKGPEAKKTENPSEARRNGNLSAKPHPRREIPFG